MTDCDSDGEEDAGPWTIGYRSCSSEYEDDLDDDDDDEHGRPKLTSRSLARDFDLIRELDLSLREDKVVFKETPFTLAQARKRDRSTPPISSCKERGATAKRGEFLPRGSLAAVRAKEAEKKQSSKESGAVGEPWRTTRKQNAIPWWKKKQTIWRNSNGDPIYPSNEDVEDQTAPPKSAKRSILEIADDITEKKGTQKKKKKIAASKQKGTTDQEPIKFRKIPRGAAATGAFPILQGFERQKALQAKNNKKKTKATTQSSDDSSKICPLEIDQLIKGNSCGPSSKPPREVTATPFDTVRPLSEYALSQSRSKYFDTSKNPNIDRVAHDQPSKPSSQLPSFGNPGLREPSHNHDTPQVSRSERPWFAGHSDDAQPSTLTHIPDSWDKNPSSSSLPYSSPLDRQDARLAHPKPQRMANMTAMTARASRAKLEELIDSSQNTRYDDPQTSPLNARSSTKQPDAIDPYSYPFLPDDWSTLPHQQKQSWRKGNASRKTVYPAKTSAKFSMPISFMQHTPQQSSQRAPSPHSHIPTARGLKLTLFHPSPPKQDLRGSQNPSPDQPESSPFAFRNRYAQEIDQERQYQFGQADSRHDAGPQSFNGIPAPRWQDKWGPAAHRSRDTAHTSEEGVSEMPPPSNRISKFASGHPSLNPMATGGGAAFGGY